MSYQTVLTNRSPFAVEKHVVISAVGQEVVLVVLVASFDAAGSALTPSPDQGVVYATDVCAGPTSESSTLYESEIVIEKPRVDVLIVGSAHAPGGRPARQVVAGFSLGDVKKQLIVTGHRVWSVGAATPPVPFTQMPLRYELAFGGRDPKDGTVFVENPLGMGFRGCRSRLDGASQLPNFEYPQSRLTAPSGTAQVAGFGVVGRNFRPRADYAGTYDQRWLDTRWPPSGGAGCSTRRLRRGPRSRSYVLCSRNGYTPAGSDAKRRERR